MVNDPDDKRPLDNDISDEIVEDPFIEETISSLEEVRVPSNLLPTVMYQVYERHHRNTLHWGRVCLIALLLALLAVIFFVLDVGALQEARGLDSFGAAFDVRLDEIISRIESFFSSIGHVLAAGWQLLLGTVRQAPFVTASIVVVLAVVVWLVRKLLLSSLR